MNEVGDEAVQKARESVAIMLEGDVGFPTATAEAIDELIMARLAEFSELLEKMAKERSRGE